MKKLFILFLVFNFIFAKTIVVDDDYSTSLWGSHDTCEDGDAKYDNIKDALNDADDGDIIRICPGTYDEDNPLEISKDNLIIESTTSNPNDVNVSANNDDDLFVITSNIDDLTFKGISLKNDNDDKETFYISNKVTNSNFINLIISSKGDGLYFNNRLYDSNLTEINGSSENIFLYIKYPKNLLINDLNIASNSNCLYFSTPRGDISIDIKNESKNHLKCKDDAIYLGNKKYGYKVLNSNIEVNGSDSSGISFKKAKYLVVDNSLINTKNKGAGIWACNSGNSVYDLNVTNTIFLNIKYENICVYKLKDALKVNNNLMLSGERGIYIKYLNSNFNYGEILSNIFKNMSDYGLYFLKSRKDRTLKVVNNCFEKNENQAYINDADAELNNSEKGNYWDDNSEDRYEVQPIPVYDEKPLDRCQITLKTYIDYRMDDCYWDDDNSTYDAINSGYTGSDYNANAGNDANTTDGGVIYKDGNFTSDDDHDKFMIPKNNIDIPSKYTLNIWIKFPLDENGHKTFTQGGSFFTSGTDYKYFNIADRSGSDNDFIYFRHNTSDDVWDLRIANSDSSDYSTIDFNPQNLSGWHMLTFVVTSDGTDFYFDGDKNASVDADPNTGKIGLIFNSDYDADNDNEPNGQSIGTLVDEFQIFEENLTSDEIKDIYNNQSQGYNWDGTIRSAPICNQEENNTKAYKFDLWDTFRDKNDKNISTKIVNKEFNITLAEFNGSEYSDDFNGTVCSTLFNEDTQKQISDWNATKWVNGDDVNETNVSFNVEKAVKKVKVYAYWIENEYDDNSSCSDIFNHEGNETNSTDNFAIKPYRFKIVSVNSKIYAGEDFNITSVALDYKDNNTTDYNESNKNSFSVIAKELKNGCKSGNFNIDVNFSNGTNTTVASYDEVGYIDINFTDSNINCNDRFAAIDCKDKNVSGYWNSDKNTTILDGIKEVKVLPYELNISDVAFSNNDSWIYMDKNLTQKSVELNLTLKAFNKNGDLLEDFNSTCYAKDVNISFDVNKNNKNEFNGTYSIIKGKSTYSDDNNFSDVNFSALDNNFTILKSDFNGGEGNLSFIFNVERNYSKPIMAFDIKFNEANITTQNLAKYENNKSLDNNISFYYARLYTQDVYLVGDKNTSEKLPILVYDDGSYFNEEKLINWYIQDNNDENFSKILGTSTTYEYNEDKNVSNFKADINLENSEFNLSLGNDSDENRFVVTHIKTPSYIWYSKYKDYNDSNKSTCLSHYCVEYHYTPLNNSNSTAGSGEFRGSEVNTTSTKEQRRGVKVYR